MTNEKACYICDKHYDKIMKLEQNIFRSFSSFSPVPLFYQISSTISSISLLPFSGDDSKWLTRVDVSLKPITIKICFIS